MKKYLQSACTGVSIGFAISLLMSLLFGEGAYLPLNPHSTVGAYYLAQYNQVTIMLICVLLWAAIGLLFQLADRIFQQDWSLARMVATHFMITLLGFTPLGILAGWFPVNVVNLLFFWLVFVMIYLVSFWVNYRTMKAKIAQINEGLASK